MKFTNEYAIIKTIIEYILNFKLLKLLVYGILSKF